MEGSSVRGYCCSLVLLNVLSLFLLPVEVMLSPDPVLLPKPLLSVEEALLALLCCSYSAALSLLYPSVVNEPLLMSAREGAFETAVPAADKKPNGISASRALIDARRTRPENEVSLARLGLLGEESAGAWIGEKVGSRGEVEGWTT